MYLKIQQNNTSDGRGRFYISNTGTKCYYYIFTGKVVHIPFEVVFPLHLAHDRIEGTMEFFMTFLRKGYTRPAMIWYTRQKARRPHI